MKDLAGRAIVAIALVALLVGCGSAGPQTAKTGGGPFERVEFKSGEFRLVGYLWVPIGLGGRGPARFPAVVWNHGSEPSVLANEGTALASFYNNAGFVFFMPIRRGHQPSPGAYRTNVSMFLAEADDVAAGIAYLRTFPSVDPSRIVVSGVSNGGIMSLLAADKGLGLRAAIAFAPGAMAWHDPGVEPLLTAAAQQVKVPTFIVQAANDFNLGPAQTLGPIVVHNQVKPHRAKVYPAYGTTPEQGHGLFGTTGFSVWGPDVLAFINQAFGK